MKMSYNELLCSAASHQLKEDEVVFVGQGFPIFASMLAMKLGKKLHLVMEAGICPTSQPSPVVSR